MQIGRYDAYGSTTGAATLISNSGWPRKAHSVAILSFRRLSAVLRNSSTRICAALMKPSSPSCLAVPMKRRGIAGGRVVGAPPRAAGPTTRRGRRTPGPGIRRSSSERSATILDIIVLVDDERATDFLV